MESKISICLNFKGIHKVIIQWHIHTTLPNDSSVPMSIDMATLDPSKLQHKS